MTPRWPRRLRSAARPLLRAGAPLRALRARLQLPPDQHAGRAGLGAGGTHAGIAPPEAIASRAAYRKRLSDIPGLEQPPEAPWAHSMFWMYGIVLAPQWNRTALDLASRLRAEGVDTRPFFVGMHQQPVFHAAFPVSGRALPCLRTAHEIRTLSSLRTRYHRSSSRAGFRRAPSDSRVTPRIRNRLRRRVRFALRRQTTTPPNAT